MTNMISSRITLELLLVVVSLQCRIQSIRMSPKEFPAYDACTITPLRAADQFTPARIAIPLFRCLTNRVLFPYHPPPGVLVSLYRPLCAMVQLCLLSSLSGTLTSPRIAVILNHDDMLEMTKCLRSFYVILMKMGGWKYYKMQDWIREQDTPRHRNVSHDIMRSVVTEAFMAAMLCLDQQHIDSDIRVTTDVAIAILRWVMEKVL